jgi:AcrR family transcriptional regulator
MRQQIKAVARRHLAAEGANLSLRAVARDMDIAASALYRYFPSRDALLNDLIIDAYAALAAAATSAESPVPRDDLRGRWLAVCRGVRNWALAHPADYGLVYGSPIRGYAAPQDTVEPAAKVILLLVGIVNDAGDRLRPPSGSSLSVQLRDDLRRMIAERQETFSEDQLDRILVSWTHLHGALNFELFGRLDEMIEVRSDYFEHNMSLMADLVGLPE